LEVVASKLCVAGKGDRSDSPTGEHREHPLDPVSDQGHHAVAALTPAGRERAGEAGASSDQLAEPPFTALALVGDGHQRRPRPRKALPHVLAEAHSVSVYV